MGTRSYQRSVISNRNTEGGGASGGASGGGGSKGGAAAGGGGVAAKPPERAPDWTCLACNALVFVSDMVIRPFSCMRQSAWLYGG
jgi:hypothetical protein